MREGGAGRILGKGHRLGGFRNWPVEKDVRACHSAPEESVGGLLASGPTCPHFHHEGRFQTLISQTSPGPRGGGRVHTRTGIVGLRIGAE